MNINDGQGFVQEAYVKKIVWESEHYDKIIKIQKQNWINNRENELKDEYKKLLILGEERKRKLKESCKDYELLRKGNDLAEWIRWREIIAIKWEIETDLKKVEILQKKFDNFKNDLKGNEIRLQEMNEIGTALTKIAQTETAIKIRQQIKNLNQRWKNLEKERKEREQQLGWTHKVERFDEDIDERRDWIQKNN